MANATGHHLDFDLVVLRILKLHLVHHQGLAHFILYSCLHEFTLLILYFYNHTSLPTSDLGKYPPFQRH
jgi:hypothetical protein